MIPTQASPIADLDGFRRVVSRRLGLSFDDAKIGLLADVFGRRLQATGQSAGAYLTHLGHDAWPAEVSALAQELTVGETYFFRNIEQYRAFAEVALPDSIGRASAVGVPVRIVSAGCASGEEPYSLAILVRETLPGGPAAGVSIAALDVNPAALDRARHARYSEWALRETPPQIRQRWFHASGRELVLAEAIRDEVTFDACNLVEERPDLWRPESCDVVFCRNVLMYLTADGAQGVVRQLARALRPGGYLFLGHAETLRGLSNSFHLRHTHDTFYYQRRDDAAAALPPSPGAWTAAPAVPPVELTALVDGADSWVDAIQRASERIEQLTRRPAARSAASPAPAPVWNVAMVLELVRRERFTDAFEVLESFPPESGRDPEVLLLRAVLLAHGSRLAKAEEACRRLLDLDELHAGAHYLLALCREGAGDRAGAAHHDQVAAYLDAGFAMPHLHRGLMARRAGDAATAREALGRAMTLLQREDPSRLLLFGGGFGRDTLVALCRAELRACGGAL